MDETHVLQKLILFCSQMDFVVQLSNTRVKHTPSVQINMVRIMIWLVFMVLMFNMMMSCPAGTTVKVFFRITSWRQEINILIILTNMRDILESRSDHVYDLSWSAEGDRTTFGTLAQPCRASDPQSAHLMFTEEKQSSQMCCCGMWMCTMCKAGAEGSAVWHWQGWHGCFRSDSSLEELEKKHTPVNKEIGCTNY